MPRKYEMRQRAEYHAKTRQRIVEAIVALHQEHGPARTTISNIAERAGVERATVSGTSRMSEHSFPPVPATTTLSTRPPTQGLGRRFPTPRHGCA
jgi:hypothetical protein